MSRLDSDLDYADWLEGPYVTCVCADCQTEFREPFDAAQTICSECFDRRDAHTSALERRLTDIAVSMVKAALPAKKGVA